MHGSENAIVVAYAVMETAQTALDRIYRTGLDVCGLGVVALDGGLAGMPAHSTCVHLAGIGVAIVAGSLAGLAIRAVENCDIFPGLNPLGAALYSLGISIPTIDECEGVLRAHGYLLVYYGAAADVKRAKRALTPAGGDLVVAIPEEENEQRK